MSKLKQENQAWLRLIAELKRLGVDINQEPILIDRLKQWQVAFKDYNSRKDANVK